MNSTLKKNRINSSSGLHVVDKLPSLRGDGFFKRAGLSTNGSKQEDQSMATDRAKQNEDETQYTLENKSTIEEESSTDERNDADNKNNNDNNDNDDGISKGGNSNGNRNDIDIDDDDDDAYTTTTTRTDNNTVGTYLQDRDFMSMSANSSAAFSFSPSGQEVMDAYPALYAPDTQAAYEKMKIEEEERKYQEAKWEPVLNVIEFFKGRVSKVLSFLERICASGTSTNK
mmetsp:Transcript_17563/g.22184  ORF Transcript_17563/g.22184 Transcript_17563/m.22184 type:complete len:228 (-) Transcript_17563:442-1125(-)|eukprot:CAMPEP_0203703392 /NCGR_PEP_ID=MMETSP0091-20130426/43023_1 /ASSEMBLY_ACC=CAM_ASM_001089 /TAXON_ID=426623 /ORGANISM="Chaetoceros affinis, Strain CCMP159" /LENGTH=227 /DNA_ID=CAMNT_0050578003 /DNA_START=277 /DNA_END=960 /DNA_ORIENTATION=-